MVKETLYDEINDIDDSENFNNLPDVSELSLEEILGSDISTFLAIKEQINIQKKRQYELKLAIREKQISIRKNQLIDEQLNVLSNLKLETIQLEKELNSYDDVELISDNEYVNK